MQRVAHSGLYVNCGRHELLCQDVVHDALVQRNAPQRIARTDNAQRRSPSHWAAALLPAPRPGARRETSGRCSRTVKPRAGVASRCNTLTQNRGSALPPPRARNLVQELWWALLRDLLAGAGGGGKQELHQGTFDAGCASCLQSPSSGGETRRPVRAGLRRQGLSGAGTSGVRGRP